MSSPLSIKYIENALQKGYGRDQIKKSLLAQGFTEADVESAFKEIDSRGANNGTAEDFLSSNVAPAPASVSSEPQQGGPQQSSFAKASEDKKVPSIWAQPSKPSQTSVATGSRIQYESASSFNWIWLGLIIIGLVALGAGVALYYVYPEQLVRFGLKQPEAGAPVLPEASLNPPAEQPIVCAQDAKECSDGSFVSRVAPTCEFAACPEIVMTPEEIKIDNMGKLRLEIEDYYVQNGVYPSSINNSDAEGFYCYRKNGIHYVLGTVLSEPLGGLGQISLDTDLDGDYYCGDAVKSCADPVYCVDPSL